MDLDQIAPRAAVPPGAGAFKKERDDELKAAAVAAANDAARQTLAAGAAAGIGCETEVAEGSVVDVLVRRAAEHDVLIVGHAPGDRGDETLLHQILKSTPRPAIVFPKRPSTGEAVVVGYDGSRQSARALASFAASGLGVGQSIHVVSCHADQGEAEANCEAAGRFLLRHGLQAVVHPEKVDRRPETVLLDYAVRRRAGLLVVGAFGHSQVHEFLFGSTTQSLLRELPLPVMLDH
jgi:nucleotide-binding universal stress UspA family protein